MGTTASQLMVQVGADVNPATAQLGGLVGMLGGPLGLAAAAAGVAVVGVGIASIKMAGDFQQGITSLVTGAGEAQSNIGLVSNGILQLATDTGTSTSQLISGMYMIESAGYHGKAGLDVLKAAAEGAKVGNADLGTVADAVTTIMKDFANQNVTASQATNALIATVAQGKTHMADLAGAMAQILPTASAAGIGLNDVMGAMATMTGEGVPAANAATYLRQTMLALEAPSAGTKKALESLGLSTTAVADEMHKSLPGALEMITSAIGKKFPEGSAGYIAALKDVAGGSKQMQGILDLTGQHMATFGDNVKSISGQVKSGGSTIQGWNLVQQDFNQTVSVFAERAEVAGIKLGMVLLPAANNLLKGIMAASDAFSGFIGWLNKGGPAADAVKGILILLTGALGGLAAYGIATAIPAIIASVTAFGAQAVAAGAAAVATLAAAAPFILIGVAIAAVAIGIYELVTHWKEVSAFLEGVWKATVAGVTAGFHWIAEEAGLLWKRVQAYFWAGVAVIQGVIRDGLNIVKTIIFGQIEAIVGVFLWLYNHNYYFKALVDAIVTEFNRAKAFITTVWNEISGWVSGTWQKIVGWATLYFDLIRAEIEARLTIVKARIQAIWNTIHDDLVAVGTRIYTTVTDAWNKVTGFITNLVNPMARSVKTGVIDPITNTITGLISNAETWGGNLLKLFISGIQGQAGALKSAVTNALGGLAKVLGFHSPAAEGPGADADTWAPNLMKMFAQGLIAATPQLAAAAAQAMQGVRSGLTGGGVGGVGSLSLSTPAGLSPAAASGLIGPSAGAVLAQAVASGATTAGAGGQQAVLVLDGRVVAQVLWPHLGHEARLATGIRS